MRFNFEIVNTEKDMTMVFKNISLDFINKLSQSMEELGETKFYIYGMYDKLEFLDENFIVLKSSKKNFVLLRVE